MIIKTAAVIESLEGKRNNNTKYELNVNFSHSVLSENFYNELG